MSPPAGAHWLPGDRLSNVRLRDAEHRHITLHAELAGAPLWLAMLATPELAGSLPAPPSGVNALCIGADALAAPQGWRSFAAEDAWRAGAGDDALWVADANLRLQERRALPLADGAAPLAPAATCGGLLLSAAPILLIPAVFEPDFCARLIEHLEVDCGGGDPSGIVVLENGEPRFALDPTIKQRRESPPRDPAIEQRMHERLSRRALPEIARVFNFQVRRRDPFKLLAYAEDAGYFHAHRDNETSDVAYRRFALSVNLNTGGYEGGEFRFPEFGPHRYSPGIGGALVFSCSLLHEVVPIRQGTRYAMTTFLA